MALTGGKRKVNKSLKAWVTFVKKVQKEENLSYKDAIHRAKVRKDKGEKWMTGGGEMEMEEEEVGEMSMPMPTSAGGRRRRRAMKGGEDMTTSDDEGMQGNLNTDGSETGMGMGGGRRRRTMRKGRSRGRRRSQSRRRSSRRR